MEVKIERLSPLHVAFVRHVGPYYEVHGAWEKVCTGLGRKGLMGPESRFIGVCYDDPEVTPPEKIRYDACVTVGTDFTPEGEVGAPGAAPTVTVTALRLPLTRLAVAARDSA